MRILRELRDEHVIKVVTGMRRCGKSTLFEMFADELRVNVPKEQIQFFNFEDLDTFSIGDYKDIHRFITQRLVPGAMNYIFLDEAQNIAGFERVVDSLHIKKNVDLYITGSNAWLLSGELATLLTGRYIEISMLPFSFAEYREACPGAPNISKEESLARFLYHGGMPQSLEISQRSPTQANRFVASVLSTVLEKDIFRRHSRTDKQAFEKILDYALDSVGSLVSPRSISDTLRSNGGIVDKGAVGRYLSYMEEAFLLYKVPRYDVRGKNILRTLDKYYMADPAFRKIRLGRGSAADRGHLLENAIYLELRRRNREVYVGKLREAEVDFIAVDDDGYISYYQVAYTVTDPVTLRRELAPLRSIGDSNPKYLLTTDRDVNPVYDGIRKLNAADWLLNGAQS
ncbi:MAG: ATP-binding protein [Peptococcaceae bacterium]|jgi:predicted AAA+ superfamily ATPase|nr:ATP-binding protein [Peptococcaceae bacterium]